MEDKEKSTILDFISGTEILDNTQNEYSKFVAGAEGEAFVEGWNRALKEVSNFIKRYSAQE